MTAPARAFNPNQKRDPDGKWGDGIANTVAHMVSAAKTSTGSLRFIAICASIWVIKMVLPIFGLAPMTQSSPGSMPPVALSSGGIPVGS